MPGKLQPDSQAIDTAYLQRLRRTLVSISSVQPHEQERAGYIADELRALGNVPEWHVIVPGRPNV